MKAPLAATALLSALLSLSANAAPGVDEVAQLIAAKLACPARDASDGFVLTTETDNAGKYLSKSVTIVDRKARRVLSRTRVWNPADPSSFQVTGYALADGVGYNCVAANAPSCTLAPLPATTPLNRQRDISARYMTFRDFITAEYGGAELSLDDNSGDVEGATWTLRVTPKGGLPMLLHADTDGTMKAIDVLYPDDSYIRTSYMDRKLFEDCETGSTMRQIQHPKDNGYIQSTLISIETRTTMTPADTPIDQPVASP